MNQSTASEASVSEKESLDVNFQFLLHAIMMHRMMQIEKFKEVYVKIFTEDLKCLKINDVIDKINECVRSTGFAIKNVTCEVSGVNYYIFVTTDNQSSRILPGTFNESQALYFREVLKLIFGTEERIVSVIDCLNINVKMPKSQIETTLKRFIERKWLIETQKGKLALSPLAFSLTEPYLKDYFEVISDCLYCKNTLFYGMSCSGCGQKTHKHCLAKYAAIKKDNLRCPSCSELWDTTILTKHCVVANAAEISEMENAEVNSEPEQELNEEMNGTQTTEMEVDSDVDITV